MRPGRPEDAEALADLHVAAWREAYEGLLSPGFLAGLSARDRLPMWRAGLDGSGGPPPLVADTAGALIGFAGTRRPTDGPRPLELWGIYVLRAWYGTGVAQGLLDAAVGDAPFSLWVARDNHRAQAFYRRNGLAPDGTEDVLEAYEGLAVVRWVR